MYNGFKLDGSAEIVIGKDCGAKCCIAEDCISKPCLAEVCLLEICAGEVRAAQIRLTEIRHTKVRPSEIRAAQVRLAKVRHAEFCSAEVRAAKVRTVEIRPAEVRAYLGVCPPPFVPAFHPLLEFCDVFTVCHGASLSLALIISCRGESGKISGRRVIGPRVCLVGTSS